MEAAKPVNSEGYGNIYAGFWSRFGANLLDGLIASPIGFLLIYLNNQRMEAYFYTLVPLLAFHFWYLVYLPRQYGGSPGKLVAGIKIVKTDGDLITWKEAILRESVRLGLTLLNAAITIACLVQADPETFAGLAWREQQKYIESFSPVFFNYYGIISSIWICSELIVLLFNNERRAVHDFIAGTLVIKSQYHEWMQQVNDLGREAAKANQEL